MGVLLLTGCSADPQPPAGTDAEIGADLFSERGCASCHRIGGTGGTLGGVTVRKTRSWVESYLRNPSAIHPESMMPSYKLSTEESKAIWAYLRFRDGLTGPEVEAPDIPFEKTVK